MKQAHVTSVEHLEQILILNDVDFCTYCSENNLIILKKNSIKLLDLTLGQMLLSGYKSLHTDQNQNF